MENMTASSAELAANPYIIDLRQLGRLAFFFLLGGILIFLLLKIILDLRKNHFDN
ncbi:MAG: hypothetical protein IJI14_02075 [Anaerolineaceae bacterium]|nr:hypothetical protein [Anaerolineaceae bacterium]